ncbi:hypothetical protein WSM22_38670 [Cytophagales bacterium WSM2-2]|nr:hypothetical protein WSM22_38670 [Cytophagales bacterium WSM2-2]
MYNAASVLQKTTDYTGEYIYQNDTLQFINHEEGRVVIKNTNTPEYQYHLKDHLGNVRVTFTTKNDVDQAQATFEPANQNAEQSKFLRMDDARIINSALFDHTHNGTTAYSERLSGSANEKNGIARSISVMPGDTIKMEVFAKYVDAGNGSNTVALNQLLAQIIAGTASAGTVIDGANYATNGITPFPFAGLAGEGSSTGAGPKAYLNYIMFDRNFVPILNDVTQTNFVRVSTAGKEDGTHLPNGNKFDSLYAQVVVKQPGYMYIYLSNEETTPVEVYFDDFKVTQVKSPVVQQEDFYPFGLSFNSYQRENSLFNKFQYNGKELQNDLSVNWYDYGARMYIPEIGRWGVVDPMAYKYPNLSPYNFVANNPIYYVDPDGREIWIAFTVTNEDGSTSQQKVQYKDGKLFGTNGKEYTGGNTYATKVMSDLNQLSKDGDDVLSERLTTLVGSEQIHTIGMPTDPSEGNSSTPLSEEDVTNNKSTGSTIEYDPDAKKSVEGKKRAPRAALAHELLSHSWDFDQGKEKKGETENGIYLREVDAVNIENRVRAVAGDPKRKKYGDLKIPAALLDDTHKKKK